MAEINQNSTKTPNKLPDGPSYPILFQTIQGLFSPLEYLENSQKKYGDIFTLRSVGFPPTVVLSNPQALQELFSAEPNLFETPKDNWILEPLLGVNSIMLLDGVRHQRERKLLMPAFHGERMRTYGQIIYDITQEVINSWKIGETFSMYSATIEISLQIILRSVFGIDQGERFQKLKFLLKSLLDFFSSPWTSSLLFFKSLQQDLGAWSPWGKFLHQKQMVDQILMDEIYQRRKKSPQEATDILSLMMLARDEEGKPLTDAQLRDELITLLFAGHETTASAIAWGMYWIHYHEQVYETLMSELKSFNQALDNFYKLPYLNAVCSETIRIYPVVLLGLARILKEPWQIMGYQLDPKTVLAPCIYLTHHRQDLYPEPKCFRPERFLEKKFSSYEYLPFGGGNRLCLGNALAIFEMKLVLATILSQVKLELAERYPIKPTRRGVILTPSGGVKMIVKSFCN